jgi:peptidoglycan/xylan/chitin deacetylase (PgdA/CDA1 family)
MIAAANAVSVDWKQEPAGTELPCLAYHAVLPHESHYLYQVSVSQFSEHLAALSSSAARVSAGARIASISFDDGYRSDFEHAFPLLQTCGFRATFFVLPGMIGTSADCISWQQAKLMISAGHRVGSHGWSHGMLTQCSSSELEREIVSSKLEIEDRLGQPVNSISVPGGRWDARTVELCARAGYETLFHSNPWAPVRKISGVVVRGRLMVTKKMRGIDLLRLANPGAMTRLIRRTGHAAKLNARKLLGEDIYHSLWCRLANFRPTDGIEITIERHTSPE